MANQITLTARAKGDDEVPMCGCRTTPRAATSRSSSRAPAIGASGEAVQRERRVSSSIAGSGGVIAADRPRLR